jgi:hypothetical protein
VTKLPSDFDIFSLSTLTKPLCIQMFANGASSGCAASLCAISFSWCGNTRSMPPVWTSKPVPRYSSAHGRALDVPARAALAPRARPAPLRLRAALPQREIERIALGLVGLDARAHAQLVDVALGQLAVPVERADRVVDVARAVGLSTAYAAPFAMSASMIAMMCGMCSETFGSTSGFAQPIAAMSSW